MNTIISMVFDKITDSIGDKNDKPYISNTTLSQTNKERSRPKSRPLQHGGNCYNNDKSREKLCKVMLEEICKGYIFEKARPNFLKNPKTNRNLEIDLYCSQLKIGLEYNSKVAHYEFNPHFHKTKEVFERAVERDRMKLVMCRNHGVDIIIVPYWIQDDKLFQYLKDEVVKIINSRN